MTHSLTSCASLFDWAKTHGVRSHLVKRFPIKFLSRSHHLKYAYAWRWLIHSSCLPNIRKCQILYHHSDAIIGEWLIFHFFVSSMHYFQLLSFTPAELDWIVCFMKTMSILSPPGVGLELLSLLQPSHIWRSSCWHFRIGSRFLDLSNMSVSFENQIFFVF